ncbi:hypothetical protein HDU93_003911 [Gonapodya sp. JEL0774]|nr:hypothetical protein HDU93_003911 [Gonapodya sp. JEL0774]
MDQQSLRGGAVPLSSITAATAGTFTTLAFNVAGLPALLQSNGVPGDKATVAGEIGTYFAKYGYDVINLQEDFNYHAYIYATDNHPYRTPTSGGAAVGSGLNTLSNFQYLSFQRIKWDKCNGVLDAGNDCLTPKGFTFMRVLVDEGVIVDMYNLHADADTTDADEVARNSNIQQVNDFITTNSYGNPVVVFGDTNSRYTRAADNIRQFTTQSSLYDAWITNIRGNSYPAAGAADIVCASNPSSDLTCEVVDKVFYRSSGAIQLTASSFQYVGSKFLQPDGNIMADHDPILVNFTWSFKDGFRQSKLFGGETGTWFNDLPKISIPSKAAVLTFRGAKRLDSVGLTLSNGVKLRHGGTGGDEVSLTLANDEYWTSAQLCRDEYQGSQRNYYIKATTSTGRTLSAGTSGSDCETFTAPSGYQIVGFFGQDGDNMDQLGFIYIPQARPTPNTAGWFRLGTATSPTKCLDFPLGQVAGTPMEIWDCSGVGVQQFKEVNGQLINRATGWCLDVWNGNAQNGQRVQLWPCNGAAAQQWTLESSVNGYYRLKLTGTNYCLNDFNFNITNGAPAVLYTCDTSAASLWIPQNEVDLFGNFALASKSAPAKCLDFPLGAIPQTQMELWDCNSGLNQRFTYRNGQLVSLSNPDMCLDLYNGVRQDGQKVDLFPCNNNAAQQWSFVANTAMGATQIRPTGSTFCLSILNSATANGSPVGISTCAENGASTWLVQS